MSFPRYPEYKDSGVEWLGEVPVHWEVKRLNHYFKERREKASDKEFIPLSVTMGGIVPRLETAAKTQDGDNRKKVVAGDFVINSRSDRKGSSGISPTDGTVSLICIVLEPQGTDRRFVHHLLRSVAFQEEFYRYGKGIVADLWSTGVADMKNIVLAMPPSKEQRAIAAFLDHETRKIDALIEEQRRLIELLKEKRQAVISHAVTKGLDPNVPMKDSGVEWLGEVPVHWQVGPLKRVWDVKDCKHVTAEFVEHGYPLASIREVQARCVDLRGAKQTTEEYYRQLVGEGRKPEAGDLIVSRNATVGEISEVADWHPLFSMGQDVCLLKRRFNGSAPGFLYYLFKSEAIGEQINSLLVGATFKRINVEEIRALNISFPPEGEQWRISRFLDREDDRFGRLIGEAERAIELLRERRSALISAGVTGKIDVRGWRAGVESDEPELAMVAEESAGYSAQGGTA